MFTGESRFSLYHHDGQRSSSDGRVWRHRGERLLNCCVMHHHNGLASRIMVWGILFHCRSPPVRIAGTLNSHRYISDIGARGPIIHSALAIGHIPTG
ncbi:transposable element Tc3 transposase [Trichonephila clavipes]|nr:transposable element Tc3 transposase [Trichonephila clavipes]